jgi:Domain of unknown function (DUF4381)
MNSDWMAQLASEHAPPPPGWWPIAPGWWAVLALLVLGGAIFFCWRKWWRDPHAKLRRAALRELREIGARDDDGPVVARAIEDLMRRYALAVFGRERVASLAGHSWLGFVATEAGLSRQRGAGASASAEADVPTPRGAGASAPREASVSTPRGPSASAPCEASTLTPGDAGASALGDAGKTLLAAAFGNSPHDQRHEWIATADAFVRRSARKRRARSAA